MLTQLACEEVYDLPLFFQHIVLVKDLRDIAVDVIEQRFHVRPRSTRTTGDGRSRAPQIMRREVFHAEELPDADTIFDLVTSLLAILLTGQRLGERRPRIKTSPTPNLDENTTV